MIRIVIFTLLGYLSGGVLFARIWGKLIGKTDVVSNSRDQNPGTANAYEQGGFWCGTLTLICDLLKGFLPVFLYMYVTGDNAFYSFYEIPVLIAPVVGHIFPVMYRFRGGKGIAVTFGVLLALFPALEPALALAICFIFFSLVIRIQPHFYRTLISYVVAFVVLCFTGDLIAVKTAFFIITVIVCLRLHYSAETRERFKVGFLWMH